MCFIAVVKDIGVWNYMPFGFMERFWMKYSENESIIPYYSSTGRILHWYGQVRSYGLDLRRVDTAYRTVEMCVAAVKASNGSLKEVWNYVPYDVTDEVNERLPENLRYVPSDSDSEYQSEYEDIEDGFDFYPNRSYR